MHFLAAFCSKSGADSSPAAFARQGHFIDLERLFPAKIRADYANWLEQ
jgi:hypothetical protein